MKSYCYEILPKVPVLPINLSLYRYVRTFPMKTLHGHGNKKKFLCSKHFMGHEATYSIPHIDFHSTVTVHRRDLTYSWHASLVVKRTMCPTVW